MFDPNTPAPWEIGVHSYVKIVGTNTEYADMDNPRGHIYGTLWVVVARDANGYQREYDLYLPTEEEAGRFANTFTGWDPDGDDWIVIDPAYGSAAYIDNDIEGQRAFQERIDAGDDPYFPNWSGAAESAFVAAGQAGL